VPTKLRWALDRLAATAGPVAPPPRDGWELVLRENVAYLADDHARETAFEGLRRATALDPARILAAPTEVLARIVVGMRPHDRIDRLRRCAELQLAGAPWKSFPGVGRPGVERIELFTGARAVLALESNGARTLLRLGYGAAGRSYDTTYRSIQRAAAAELPADVDVLTDTHLLLRRHGQTVCRRLAPACDTCALARRCDAAAGGQPIGDPFAAK
jgi:endonuclease III-like uncharacterized protein